MFIIAALKKKVKLWDDNNWLLMEQKRAISRPNSSSYDLVGCYIIIVSKIISFKKKKSSLCEKSITWWQVHFSCSVRTGLKRELIIYSVTHSEKMAVTLTLMYEHPIEGKVHSAGPLYLNPNRQKSNRKWFKTKWIKPEGGGGGEPHWLRATWTLTRGGRCQERMADEENAAAFILIC